MGACYTENQLAEYLGVTVKKLRKDRLLKKGVPFVKIGRCVRYRKEDVDAYVEANCQAPEGYVRPEPQKASSEAMLNPGSAEKDPITADKPMLTDWKAQVLDAMLSNGVITKRFTGEVSFRIENGKLNAVLKQEEL
ncbi:MAG TPA: helix-turn-helix domain-containing protein [Geobacteraceae bacterium]|nr:helix-turn-helix domain-containing protein [Geobacteraceae bacterium]